MKIWHFRINKQPALIDEMGLGAKCGEEGGKRRQGMTVYMKIKQLLCTEQMFIFIIDCRSVDYLRKSLKHAIGS